jgi:hypothetical protein
VNFSHNLDIDNSDKDQIDFKTFCIAMYVLFRTRNLGHN